MVELFEQTSLPANTKTTLDLKKFYPAIFILFKRLTFVGSAWSFGFFIPATRANDLRLRRISYPIFYPLQLILKKEFL